MQKGSGSSAAPPVRCGILGGGQLSMMLVEAARGLGLEPRVLATSSPEEKALPEFLAQVDLVAFENEFIDCAALERLSSRGKPRFVPALPVIARVSEKLEQKRLFDELGLPSAPYVVFDRRDPRDWLAEVGNRLGSRFVVKWSKHGYDGKGNFFVASDADHAGAAAFVSEALRRGIAVYAEKAVAFRRELAIVASHSVRGDLAFFPLVISVQQQGVCKWVEGPATSLGVPAELEARAREFATALARKLPLHGTFAIELFETPEGLLVNELAPRVHNTGHYSIEACETSQFENHWRAILGMPLGQTKAAAAFGMLNLLGPRACQRENAPGEPPTGSHLHWYGKKGFQPGRKLGHVTCVSRDVAELARMKKGLETYDEAWKKSCT